jgi:glucosamine-6-phosphate deaminase
MEQEHELSQRSIERSIINLAIDKGKNLTALTDSDLKSDKFGKLVLNRTKRSAQDIGKEIYDNLEQRFERGMEFRDNERFLHTAPHHDDIMLGYLPYLNHLVRTPKNKHHFTYLTS